MRRALATLLLALGAAGCAPALQEGFDEELTRKGACADMLFFAANAEGSIALSFTVPPLIEAFLASGDPEQSTAWTLPDRDVVAVVELGTRVDDALCDDVIENGGPQVAATYVPTQGSLTVRLRPGATAEDTRADLILTNAIFVRDVTGAGDVPVQRVEILDVIVGWFPG